MRTLRNFEIVLVFIIKKVSLLISKIWILYQFAFMFTSTFDS